MAALMRKCEIAILTCDKLLHEISEFPDFVTRFLEGKYEDILDTDEIARQILSPSNVNKIPSNFESFISQNLDSVIAKTVDDAEIRDLGVLVVAASCLQLFVQNNWIGPPTSKDPLKFCSNHFDQKVESEAFDEMGLDGEIIYTKSRFVVFLYIAKIILLEYRSQFTHLQTWDWWLMRCLSIQQALLSDRSPLLRSTTTELIDTLTNKEPLMTDESNRNVQVLFYVEAGYLYHTYYEYKRAAESFDTAKKIAGINVELTGAMGKRSRYQEENRAQLVLKVTRDKEPAEDTSATCLVESNPQLPKILPLDDDTFLNEVAYLDIGLSAAYKLSQYEQVLILGIMESHRRSRAEEKLTTEEVLTYIAHILKNVTNWNVAVSALSIRSKLEKDKRRTVERSMRQFEELSNKASKADSSPDVASRISLFYAANVPSVWTIQKDFASLLLSLGLIGEALDIFEKLEMWEEAISCYQTMGKKDKAEATIRQRLAVKETPALWCFLGDVTREVEHYQKAWEMSHQRSARAMRGMAYIHFHEKRFDKAIECFSASLKVNSLQIPVWFSYGCAAMAAERFDVGASAFKRCVAIDFDNFEAWANLASCYVKLKEKHKAFSTLQDALKCNYDNWKLWENSLIISTDCGEFQHAITSYHRVMDIKKKYIDAEVLGILAKAVIEKLPDPRGNSAERLWDKVTELFGRVTSQITTEGDIWSSYASLYACATEGRQPNFEKALGFQQRALRCYTQKVDWEKDVAACKKVVDKASTVVDLDIQCIDGKSTQDILRVLPASRLAIKGALSKIQKQHTDPITQELGPEVTDLCKDLELSLTRLQERIDSAKAAT